MRPSCKSCKSEYSKKNRINNREKLIEAGRSWRRSEKGKEYNNEYQREWRRKNPVYHKQYNKKHALLKPEMHCENQRRYRKKNPDKNAATCSRRKAKKLQAAPEWANQFFIEEIFHLARLRTKAFGYPWHVDHIVPLKHKLVCGLHCEQNLQVIPATENLKKNNFYEPGGEV